MTKNYLIAGFLVCAAACGGDDGKGKGDDKPEGDAGGSGNLDGGANRLDSGKDGSRPRADGGGLTDGGSASLGVLCLEVCAQSAKAACAADSDTLCRAGCSDPTGGVPGACLDAYRDAVTCAADAPFVCDSTGQSAPVGCDPPFYALGVCLLGNAPDSGTEPALDSGTSKGDAATPDAASSDAAASDAASPGTDAGDASASDAGDASASDAGDASLSDAGDGAVQGDGSVPSLCPADPTDDACAACGSAKCCDEFVACGAGCQKGAACIEACATDDAVCIAGCAAAATPADIDQYSALTTCYVDQCADACAAP